MIQDVRKGIKSSFLYKRFAYYQSEGFTALINFLQDENLLDKFWEEFSFSKSTIERELKFFKKPITIEDLFFQKVNMGVIFGVLKHFVTITLMKLKKNYYQDRY